MAIEIVDFPSYKMVIFHSYVSLPEGLVNITIAITDLINQLIYLGGAPPCDGI